jgi:hypothetical protein
MINMSVGGRRKINSIFWLFIILLNFQFGFKGSFLTNSVFADSEETAITGSKKTDSADNKQTNNAVSKKYFNINRLQYRHSFKNGDNIFSQTSNIEFFNNFFLFEHFEYVDNGYYFLEIYTGKPFSNDYIWGKSFGWVARTEAAKGLKTIYSLGAIWYISDTPAIDELLKKIKLKSFLEVFFIKSNNDHGPVDLFHHYTFPITESLYLRGYNRVFFDTEQGTLFYAVQDIIYPLTKYIDVYLRHDYQNEDGFQNRTKGSDFSVGARYNFSF